MGYFHFLSDCVGRNYNLRMDEEKLLNEEREKTVLAVLENSSYMWLSWSTEVQGKSRGLMAIKFSLWGIWMASLVEYLPSAQVMILESWD